MENTKFTDLKLIEPILSALDKEGYQYPTPVQAQAIPQILTGIDMLGTAQTGTGKTAAFVLPILQRLQENPTPKGRPIRALILAPTRELALQIDSSIQAYGADLPLKSAVVLGGVNMNKQINAIKHQPDILVATPGRLIDLHKRGVVQLGQTEIVVLDEADRMLDMGFVHAVRFIISQTPENRQTLLFSATMSFGIQSLARRILNEPVMIEITPPASVSTNITQKVYFVDQTNKRDLLVELLNDDTVTRALIFTSTKIQAEAVRWKLNQSGVKAEAIHSNKTQRERQLALSNFDKGLTRILIGTDIVARGIDVDDISHVINFDLPDDHENYVHRIGRTARAEAKGVAYTLCDYKDITVLRKIRKLTKGELTIVEGHPYHDSKIASLDEPAAGVPVTSVLGRRKVISNRRMNGRRR